MLRNTEANLKELFLNYLNQYLIYNDNQLPAILTNNSTEHLKKNENFHKDDVEINEDKVIVKVNENNIRISISNFIEEIVNRAEQFLRQFRGNYLRQLLSNHYDNLGYGAFKEHQLLTSLNASIEIIKLHLDSNSSAFVLVTESVFGTRDGNQNKLNADRLLRRKQLPNQDNSSSSSTIYFINDANESNEAADYKVITFTQAAQYAAAADNINLFGLITAPPSSFPMSPDSNNQVELGHVLNRFSPLSFKLVEEKLEAWLEIQFKYIIKCNEVLFGRIIDALKNNNLESKIGFAEQKYEEEKQNYEDSLSSKASSLANHLLTDGRKGDKKKPVTNNLTRIDDINKYLSNTNSDLDKLKIIEKAFDITRKDEADNYTRISAKGKGYKLSFIFKPLEKEITATQKKHITLLQEKYAAIVLQNKDDHQYKELALASHLMKFANSYYERDEGTYTETANSMFRELGEWPKPPVVKRVISLTAL